MRPLDIATVIVTYKSARLTIECLKTVEIERRAAGLHIRVVVVDNASGDLAEIRAAVEERGWNWVTLIPAARNGGFAYGNNIGIRSAYESGRPDYVFLLNPDTELRAGAVGILAGFLEKHPDVGIAGSSFETEDGKDWPFAFRFPSIFSEIEQGLRLGVVSRLLSRWVVARTMERVAQPTDWICGAAMMIRPKVLETIGALDENYFLYYEETELCHRASRAGFPTWYVPESRVMHAIGKSTNVRDDSRFRRRLPGFWFDSRRRYYAMTHGVMGAALIDAAAIFFRCLGLMRAMLTRRPSTPHFIRDLISHSIAFRRNRPVAPIKAYFPPG